MTYRLWPIGPNATVEINRTKSLRKAIFVFLPLVTLYNLAILKYPYHIDLLHPGDMPIENFIPQTFCVGFISSITFDPVGHSPLGHVCYGL